MSNGISKEAAQQYLEDVTPMWRAFWFHMHLHAKNLEEFCEGLRQIDDGVYSYHSEGHGDLTRWVREVIGDGELADELEKVKTREEAVEVTCRRVKELQKIVGA